MSYYLCPPQTPTTPVPNEEGMARLPEKLVTGGTDTG